jgi:HD-GYP domain-containing protein (c-di-GMP phosphodiesterase class II)/DNA-binding CsgD family transcriptional regulator
VPPASAEVRSGELFAALSLALDLSTGEPLEHALRTCLIGLALADRLGLDEDERRDVYLLALLHSIGCTADSPEAAARYGDDIGLRFEAAPVDIARQPEVAKFLWRASGKNVRRFTAVLAAGPKTAANGLRAHCEVGERLAEMLSLGPRVQDALWYTFERFDGKGFPRGVGGDEIPLAARVVHVARDLHVLATRSSAEGAEATIAERSGGAYDPSIAAAAPGALGSLPGGSVWDAVARAPEGGAPLRDDALDRACRAVAYVADLKSTHTLEHSTGVAELAEAAGWRLGMGEDDVAALRRAALLHDLGRVGVSTAIWDRPGSLTESEWERVRLHPYYTQRALSRADGLGPIVGIAAAHHERLDGSGYPSGTAGVALDQPSCVLAAADAYHAMCETRAHRPAHEPDRAADELEEEARAGRLDPGAVDAVLGAAGRSRDQPKREWPGGLTEREVEVLRLVARGASNRAAAEQLGISPKTVGHHVQHVYSKIGVSTRAGAAVFAMQNDLLREP